MNTSIGISVVMRCIQKHDNFEVGIFFGELFERRNDEEIT